MFICVYVHIHLYVRIHLCLHKALRFQWAEQMQASGLRQTTVDQHPKGTEYQGIIKALTNKASCKSVWEEACWFGKIGSPCQARLCPYGGSGPLKGGCSACVGFCVIWSNLTEFERINLKQGWDVIRLINVQHDVLKCQRIWNPLCANILLTYISWAPTWY